MQAPCSFFMLTWGLFTIYTSYVALNHNFSQSLSLVDFSCLEGRDYFISFLCFYTKQYLVVLSISWRSDGLKVRTFVRKLSEGSVIELVKSKTRYGTLGIDSRMKISEIYWRVKRNSTWWQIVCEGKNEQRS